MQLIFIFMCRSTIELLKETQKLRQRHHGITADQLAAGKEYKKERRTAVCLFRYVVIVNIL